MIVDHLESPLWKKFYFRTIQIKDLDLVFNHLSKYYLRHEPVHLALEECSEDTIVFDKQIFEVLLKQNLSFITVDTETSEVSNE